MCIKALPNDLRKISFPVPEENCPCPLVSLFLKVWWSSVKDTSLLHRSVQWLLIQGKENILLQFSCKSSSPATVQNAKCCGKVVAAKITVTRKPNFYKRTKPMAKNGSTIYKLAKYI